MSVAAIPKPAGTRPPIPPPGHTTYDSSPDDSREPMHKVIAESVQRLLKVVNRTPDDQLEPYLDLLLQRKRWIEDELAAQRLLERPVLPPLIVDFASVEPFIGFDDPIVRQYQRLANQLEESIRQVRARLWVLNQDVFTSER